jgi:hypothetical protein
MPPIEILVPIGIFVFGMVISHLTSSAAVALVEENRKNK